MFENNGEEGKKKHSERDRMAKTPRLSRRSRMAGRETLRRCRVFASPSLLS
jgi:hypothetical protein